MKEVPWDIKVLQEALELKAFLRFSFGRLAQDSNCELAGIKYRQLRNGNSSMGEKLLVLV